MPTYVYGCDACGHRFEKFQKFSDEPVRVCPECGNSVRRIFQPAGIVFKGSGWHITDYKRGGANGSDAGDAKAAKPDSKPEPAKSEPAKTEPAASTSSGSAAADTKS